MSAKTTSSEHYSTDSSSDDSEQNDQYNNNLPQSSHNNSAVNLLNRRMSYLSPIMTMNTTEPIINDTGYVREETRQSIRRQSIMIVMKNEEIRKEKVEKLLLEREIVKKEAHNVKKGKIYDLCFNVCVVLIEAYTIEA